VRPCVTPCCLGSVIGRVGTLVKFNTSRESLNTGPEVGAKEGTTGRGKMLAIRRELFGVVAIHVTLRNKTGHETGAKEGRGGGYAEGLELCLLRYG